MYNFVSFVVQQKLVEGENDLIMFFLLIECVVIEVLLEVGVQVSEVVVNVCVFKLVCDCVFVVVCYGVGLKVVQV